MNDLQKLMDFIGTQYVFDKRSYPRLGQPVTEMERKIFAINHSLLHMAKSQGKIATYVEACDHGDGGDEVALREATVKMLINTLKLAEEIGVTAQELIEVMPGLMKSVQNTPKDWFQKLLPPKQRTRRKI